MQIDLRCASCGSSRFDYPFELRSDSLIKCGGCGRNLGTVADMQRKVIQALEGEKASA